MHSLSSRFISSGSVIAKTGLLPSIFKIFRPYSLQALTQAKPQAGVAVFFIAGSHRL
jgi:hypothetical protein